MAERPVDTDRELTRTALPRLAAGYRFQWEEAQGCWVLLYPEGMITLNGSAGAILKNLGDGRTVGDLIAALEAEFPGAELAGDVLAFLEHARGRGWLELD